MNEERVYRGTIVGLSGSWGSGLAMLMVEDHQEGFVSIPADNGPLVRALEDAFGEVIGEGHTVNLDAIEGRKIYYVYDEMGLTLGGFVPVEEATVELEEAYEARVGGAIQ